jgi:hypothetical protein
MALPHMMLYCDGEQNRDPSGGLLWVMLKSLSEPPIGGRLLLQSSDDDEVFMHAARLPAGYQLFAQAAEERAVVAYPVTFGEAIAALMAWNVGQEWRSACAWQPLPEPHVARKPPELIRIAYERDSMRTDALGRYADGQFLALTHGTRTNSPGMIGVAVFLFDHFGTLIRADIHNDVPLDEADALRGNLIRDLADIAYGDIGIRTFAVECEGVTWTLVDQTEKFGEPRVSFYPLDILFKPPWDGTYDT